MERLHSTFLHYPCLLVKYLSHKLTYLSSDPQNHLKSQAQECSYRPVMAGREQRDMKPWELASCLALEMLFCVALTLKRQGSPLSFHFCPEVLNPVSPMAHYADIINALSQSL